MPTRSSICRSFVLALFSFNSSRFAVWQGFTLHWYGDVFQNETLIEATLNSLTIGLVSTVFATVIGTLAGYAIWKKRLGFLTNSFYLSLLTPEIVTGVSLLAFFQWIFHFMRFRLGMHTVILAHISFCLAYVVVVDSGAACAPSTQRWKKPLSIWAQRTGRCSAT